MPPNEPKTVSPTPTPSSVQPTQDLPDNTPTAPLPPSTGTSDTSTSPLPPTVPPKTHKSLMVLFLIIVLIAVAVGAYYATRSTKPKTPSPSTSTVITEPGSLTPALVSITKTGFDPATISVKVGQAVVWTNNDNSSHLVASDPYPTDNTLLTFNSKQALAANDSYSYVFNHTGTFTYHDDLNPYSLKGIVIVNKD